MAGNRFEVGHGDGPLGGYVLRDHETGSEARVLPDVGANCVELRVPDRSGQPMDLMYAPESPAQLQAAPARYGLPILFPFPNRIRDGRFTFGGTTYQLPVGRQGHAIHGLVIDRPFRVEQAEGTVDGARLRCVITPNELATTQGYPFPFHFAADYTLQGHTLILQVTATNTGSSPMPMGFGIHPYFRTPIAPNGERARCEIAVPVRERWVLGPDLIPTGQRETLTPAETLTDLAPLDGRTFDNVYTGVAKEGGESRCRLFDPAAGIELIVASDAAFREIVVYAPPGLPALCFEPYTCTTDAFNLQERGVDAGRMTLEPGARWVGTIEVSCQLSGISPQQGSAA